LDVPVQQHAAPDRDRNGRRRHPRDRPRSLRANRHHRPSGRALQARQDDEEAGRQEPEQRAISRDSPGLRGDYGERAKSADDCLGRTRALDHPAMA